MFQACSVEDVSIEVTMSDIIRPVDLSDNDLAYGTDYEHYDKKDDYLFYNCVLKVVNHSKYDILNVYLTPYESNDFCIDTKYTGHRFTIQPNETEYVAGVISVKKGISESEKQNIVNNIKSEVVIDIGYAYENKAAEIEKTITKSFNIINENYFNNEVYYPDGLGSSIAK